MVRYFSAPSYLGKRASYMLQTAYTASFSERRQAICTAQRFIQSDAIAQNNALECPVILASAIFKDGILEIDLSRYRHLFEGLAVAECPLGEVDLIPAL